ncbi:MAG TPA: hypothetical protein VGB73_11720 [Pyrinomonadaceae bacterium]
MAALPRLTPNNPGARWVRKSKGRLRTKANVLERLEAEVSGFENAASNTRFNVPLTVSAADALRAREP